MNHTGTRRIETERLILRHFQEEDAPSVFHNWASDPEVTRYLTWPAHSEIKVTETVLQDWINSYDQPDFYQWAIVLKDLNEPIGSISVAEADEAVNMIEIGYCIGQPWWHQGIMTEALSAVINFFFNQENASRIQTKHDVNNPHSGDVMKKCRMKFEGILRQSGKNNSGICDLAIYGLLRKDQR